MKQIIEKTILDEITATNTPDAIDIKHAKKITLEFTEGGTVNNRSGELVITASIDDSTFVTIYPIDNVANDNSKVLTRVASKTRAAAGTDLLFLDLKHFGFSSIKATCTITDGADPTGNFTLKALIEY
jgi:hypothetical protein